MSTSQRILSGSKTKGSRVTQQSEMIPFYQGTNVKTIGVVGDRLNPQLRSGDLLGVFKDNKRMRGPTYDDTITINNTLNDLREDEDRFEQKLVFDFEKANFGVAPETLQGEPFADLIDFDPVVYLQDPGEFMYPANLWNLGELPNHEFNGIMEVFDKRTSILGLVDLRYQGKTTRGALVGSATERPWGSIEIEDKWRLSDKSYLPFLDAPPGFYKTFHQDAILGPKSNWFLSALNISGYAYSEADASSILLMSNLDVPPVDGTSNLTLTYEGATPADYKINPATIGSNPYKAHEYTGGTYPTNADAWINFATAGALSGIDAAIGSGQGTVMQSTYSAWLRLTELPHNPSCSTHGILAVGQAQGSTGGGNINIYYQKVLSKWYFNISLADVSPNVYKGSGSVNSGLDYWRLESADDQLEDGAWHHLAVSIKITNGTGNGAWHSTLPRNGRTLVEPVFYVDGVEYPAVRQTGTSNFYSDWKIIDEDLTSPGTQPGYALWGDANPTYSPFRGEISQPAIWKTQLPNEAVKAIYAATRTEFNSLIDGHVPLTESESKQTLVPYEIQGYQDIRSAAGSPATETDHHDSVYKRVSLHNENDIMNALKLLNSASCNTIADPFEKTASRGFYFGHRAGSITFGDVYMLGEHE